MSSMIYRYTWGHILLFAQMCNCDDTNETVTDNWVNMLENHHEKMFPFTLWPLTYRTSAVIASPCLLSPFVTNVVLQKGQPDQARVVVKFYRSNEVIVMCFQHIGEHNPVCSEMCTFESGSKLVKGHGEHSSDNNKSLVPCSIMSIYSKVKKKSMIELYKCRENDGKSIKCIICTGYDIGAVLASFMACDLANDFKMEAEFMELDEPIISVDCISFSNPGFGNETYWSEFDSLVDEHINIKHLEEPPIKDAKVVFVGNRDVPLKTKPKFMMRSRSVKKILNHNKVPCQRYLEDIDKKINIQI